MARGDLGVFQWAFFCALLLACEPPPGGPPSGTSSSEKLSVAPMAVFDWSMPDRLRIDPSTHLIAEVPVNPGSWRVDFNACASSGGLQGPIVAFHWQFEGDPVMHSTGDCRISPGFVHAAASSRIFRLYSPVNRRRRGFADTSASCATNPISALLTMTSKLALLH